MFTCKDGAHATNGLRVRCQLTKETRGQVSLILKRLAARRIDPLINPKSTKYTNCDLDMPVSKDRDYRRIKLKRKLSKESTSSTMVPEAFGKKKSDQTVTHSQERHSVVSFIHLKKYSDENVSTSERKMKKKNTEGQVQISSSSLAPIQVFSRTAFSSTSLIGAPERTKGSSLYLSRTSTDPFSLKINQMRSAGMSKSRLVETDDDARELLPVPVSRDEHSQQYMKMSMPQTSGTQKEVPMHPPIGSTSSFHSTFRGATGKHESGLTELSPLQQKTFDRKEDELTASIIQAIPLRTTGSMLDWKDIVDSKTEPVDWSPFVSISAAMDDSSNEDDTALGSIAYGVREMVKDDPYAVLEPDDDKLGRKIEWKTDDKSAYKSLSTVGLPEESISSRIIVDAQPSQQYKPADEKQFSAPVVIFESKHDIRRRMSSDEKAGLSSMVDIYERKDRPSLKTILSSASISAYSVSADTLENIPQVSERNIPVRGAITENKDDGTLTSGSKFLPHFVRTRDTWKQYEKYLLRTPQMPLYMTAAVQKPTSSTSIGPDVDSLAFLEEYISGINQYNQKLELEAAYSDYGIQYKEASRLPLQSPLVTTQDYGSSSESSCEHDAAVNYAARRNLTYEFQMEPLDESENKLSNLRKTANFDPLYSPSSILELPHEDESATAEHDAGSTDKFFPFLQNQENEDGLLKASEDKSADPSLLRKILSSEDESVSERLLKEVDYDADTSRLSSCTSALHVIADKEEVNRKHEMFLKNLSKAQYEALALYLQKCDEDGNVLYSDVLPLIRSHFREELITEKPCLEDIAFIARESVLFGDCQNIIENIQQEHEMAQKRDMAIKGMENDILESITKHALHRYNIAKERRPQHHFDVTDENDIRILPMKYKSSAFIPARPRALLPHDSRILLRTSGKQKRYLTPPVDLMVYPEHILFTRFVRGRTYTKTFKIINVTQGNVFFDVLPLPFNRCFEIEWQQPPANPKMLAAGLSIQVKVLFHCKTLENCREILKIKTHSGTDTLIHFNAYRRPPCLEVKDVDNTTLGNADQEKRSTFECGKSLIGTEISVSVRLYNMGSRSSFWIMTLDEMTTRTITSPPQLDQERGNVKVIKEFTVSPACFNLRRGESVEVNAVFRPLREGFHAEFCAVFCDNCKFRRLNFTGDGIRFSEDFISIKDISKSFNVLVDDDLSSEYHLNIGPIVNGLENAQTIEVLNKSPVVLKYHWEKRQVCIPTYAPLYEFHMPFDWIRVEPEKGKISPSEQELLFQVICEPNGAIRGKYRTVLQLVLDSISVLNFTEERPPMIKMTDCSDVVDVIVAEVEVWAECGSPSLCLEPCFIKVNRLVRLGGSPHTCYFQIINTGNEEVVFNLHRAETENFNLDPKPVFNSVLENQILVGSVDIQPTSPGKNLKKFACTLSTGEKVAEILVSAEVAENEVKVSEVILDFETIRHGTLVKRCLSVINTGSLEVTWIAKEYVPDPKTYELIELPYCRLFPTSGVLEKNGDKNDVAYYLNTKETGIWLSVVVIQLTKDKCLSPPCSFITIVAHVWKPEVSLYGLPADKPMIMPACLYVGVEYKTQVTIRNVCDYSVTITWGEPTGDQKCYLDLKMKPQTFLIPPRGIATTDVFMMPRYMGDLHDYYVPCYIGRDKIPLILGVVTEVKGRITSFSFPPLATSDIVYPSEEFLWCYSEGTPRDGSISLSSLCVLKIPENLLCDKHRALTSYKTGCLFSSSTMDSALELSINELNGKVSASDSITSDIPQILSMRHPDDYTPPLEFLSVNAEGFQKCKFKDISHPITREMKDSEYEILIGAKSGVSNIDSIGKFHVYFTTRESTGDNRSIVFPAESKVSASDQIIIDKNGQSSKEIQKDEEEETEEEGGGEEEEDELVFPENLIDMDTFRHVYESEKFVVWNAEDEMAELKETSEEVMSMTNKSKEVISVGKESKHEISASKKSKQENLATEHSKQKGSASEVTKHKLGSELSKQKNLSTAFSKQKIPVTVPEKTDSVSQEIPVEPDVLEPKIPTRVKKKTEVKCRSVHTLRCLRDVALQPTIMETSIDVTRNVCDKELTDMKVNTELYDGLCEKIYESDEILEEPVPLTLPLATNNNEDVQPVTESPNNIGSVDLGMALLPVLKEASANRQNPEIVLLDVKCFKEKTAYFTLRNVTPIVSAFKIKAKHFQIQRHPERNTQSAILRAIHGVKKDKWSYVKGPNEGLLTDVEPLSGTLQEYGRIDVTVSVYATTWGIYEESIVCKVFGMHPFTVKLIVEVTGYPVYFPLAETSASLIPMLRFDTVSYEEESVEKSLCLHNNCGLNISVSWHMFIVQPHENEQTPPFTILFDMYTPLNRKKAVSSNHSIAEDVKKLCVFCLRENKGEMKDTLFDVILQPYQGEESFNTFRVEPMESFLRPYGECTITVKLLPRSISVVDNKPTIVRGTLIGVIRIPVNNTYCEGRFYRPDGHDLDPLILNVSASVEIPRLTFELEAGLLNFRINSTDVMQSPSKRFSLTKTLLARNYSYVPLKATALTSKPFFVDTIDTLERKFRKFKHKTDNITTFKLNYEECAEISVTCIVTEQDVRDAITIINDVMSENYDDTKMPKITGKEFKIDRPLTFNQSFQMQQTLYVGCTISFPILRLQPPVLDFGFVSIKKRRSMMFDIINESVMTVPFKLEMEPNNSFDIRPKGGILDPKPVGGLSFFQIRVSYAPRSVEQHIAQVSIRTPVPDVLKKISLSGTGIMYDENVRLFLYSVSSSTESSAQESTYTENNETVDT